MHRNTWRYSVYKCKSGKDDSRSGHTHFSDDGFTTLCGKDIDSKWYIFDNRFEGFASCPKCKKIEFNPPMIDPLPVGRISK